MENMLSIESIILLCLMLIYQYDEFLKKETDDKLYGQGPLLYDTFFFTAFKAVSSIIMLISIIVFSVRFEWWYSLIYLFSNYILMVFASILILAPIVKAINRFFFSIISRAYIDREHALEGYCIGKGRLFALAATFILDIWVIVLWFV